MDTLSSDILSLFLFGGKPSAGHPLGLGLLLMYGSLLLALGASTRIDIIAKYTGLKTIPSLAFSIPKNSLWIVKVVSHTCTVVFCRFMVWL